jgi:hypothetical protein
MAASSSRCSHAIVFIIAMSTSTATALSAAKLCCRQASNRLQCNAIDRLGNTPGPFSSLLRNCMFAGLHYTGNGSTPTTANKAWQFISKVLLAKHIKFMTECANHHGTHPATIQRLFSLLKSATFETQVSCFERAVWSVLAAFPVPQVVLLVL